MRLLANGLTTRVPRLSTCVLVLFAATTALPWGGFAWMTLTERSGEIDKAQAYLAAAAAAYAERAATLKRPDANGERDTILLRERLHLARVRFSQTPIAASAASAPAPIFQRKDGVITAVVDRPASGIATLASASEDEVLASWRSRARFGAVALFLRTLVAAIVGAFLVHQLRWEESAQAQLNATREAAEAATRAKSEFLANMSHELRTPLNAIIGFAEVVKTGMVGPLGARYREYGGYIFDSGKHLLDLINEILDLSKLEAGQMELQEDNVDPASLLRSAMRLVQPQAEKAKIRLTGRTENDLPLIRGDERRLRQVLVNLLANAVKFTPQGGRVHISIGAMINGRLAFKISDTGIGMPAAQIPQALKPFVQIKTRLAAREGTGLGLPIAKHLVELHGGTLSIDSDLDAGTTATVTLPVERMIAPQPRRQPASAAS